MISPYYIPGPPAVISGFCTVRLKGHTRRASRCRCAARKGEDGVGIDATAAAAAALGVTSENWLDPPFNRLGFRCVGSLVRTATIARGDGPVFELPRRECDLAAFTFEHRGRSLDLDTMLAETYTDGFLL